MGFSIGFGVGPVRYSKRLGGGGRRSSARGGGGGPLVSAERRAEIDAAMRCCKEIRATTRANERREADARMRADDAKIRAGWAALPRWHRVLLVVTFVLVMSLLTFALPWLGLPVYLYALYAGVLRVRAWRRRQAEKDEL